VDEFLSESRGQQASLRLATWLISHDSIPDVEQLAKGNATQVYPKPIKQSFLDLLSGIHQAGQKLYSYIEPGTGV
jgi:hypothetical protein